MPSSVMLRCVVSVSTEVSEERIASIVPIIKKTKISELGTTLVVTRNLSIYSLRASVASYCQRSF
jgi:hypothetical protein